MRGFFNIDGKFMTVMNRIADLMLLNVIFIICCLPIVTIGASTTALYYVTLKMVKNEESYIVKSFFKSFKENFRQATVIWIVILAAGILLYVDIQIVLVMQSTISKILLPFIGVVAIILLFVNAYVFPLLSRFENTIKQTVKNALFMSIRHLPMTVIIILITVVPLLVGLYYLVLLPIWILGGFSALAYGASHIFVKIFKNYVKQEEETNETTDIEE